MTKFSRRGIEVEKVVGEGVVKSNYIIDCHFLRFPLFPTPISAPLGKFVKKDYGAKILASRIFLYLFVGYA